MNKLMVVAMVCGLGGLAAAGDPKDAKAPAAKDMPMPKPPQEIADMGKMMSGTWNCSGKAYMPDNSAVDMKGTMKSKVDMNGFYMHDSWSSKMGKMDFTFESYTSYDAAAKKWRRTMVDSFGGMMVGTSDGINSPLAGEAMYRSADIRWQIDKPDVMTRPSARDSKSPMREGINDDFMKQVMKKFPGTKWADLAAFHLVDNKLCSDWQGASKCPDKEADAYEKYANEHPQSPALGEALYDAAWRRAALIEIYKTEDQAKKSEESRSKAMALAQKAAQASQGDWGARAQRLLYMISQGIPTYGNAED